MSFLQYARFLITGAVVAAITVGCRELIGRFLFADTPFYYSLSVVLAYVVGIILSFLLNQMFTFRRKATEGDWLQFARFVAIALVGMLSTWLISLGLRYGLSLDRYIGTLAAAAAFATAAFLSSAITYPLNALLVFRTRDSTAIASNTAAR